MTQRIVLGSASPRRKRILSELGVAFDCVSPCVVEHHDVHDPIKTVTQAAMDKFNWCRERCPEAVILTADTAVEFEGRCLGKPRDEQQALEWLCAYSRKEQRVYTAVAVGRPRKPVELRVVKSVVRFKPITSELARRYIALARPLDRAGAYDIDTHGDMIIASHDGSYTNIMGLPSETVMELIASSVG